MVNLVMIIEDGDEIVYFLSVIGGWYEVVWYLCIVRRFWFW